MSKKKKTNNKKNKLNKWIKVLSTTAVVLFTLLVIKIFGNQIIDYIKSVMP